jgi:hypothetical protein
MSYYDIKTIKHFIEMVVVVVATDSEIKRAAFETSEIAAHLRAIGVNYQFMNVDGVVCSEFEGPRWSQPFTASGGMFAAMQRISAVRGRADELPHSADRVKHYDESGMLLGVSSKKEPSHAVKDDRVVIAIESYITENNKDCVCVVVNYYDADGKKREFIAFSPAAYIASFPDKYLQHLAVVEKYKPGIMGFKTTIGDVIELEKHAHGGGVSKNWHKLFNPFDRVEQIRGTLNYIADEFKKFVTA